MLFAGIDIGTTSISVVLISAASGRVVRVATCANDASIRGDHSWERLQNPERIMERVRGLLAECREEWADVAAVGISCQMHGILYVDGEGQSVSPLFTWQDGRGDEPMQDRGVSYARHLRECTGYPAASGFGLVTHFHHVKNGNVPNDAVYLCTIGDYAAMQLTGAAKPLMDPSNAAGIGLFSASRHCFDEEALRRAGMDASILPPVCHGTEPVGRTRDGKPVACAIGDNQASFLGSVSQLERTLLVNVGTGSQISIYTDNDVSPEELDPSAGLEIRPFPGGGSLLVGAPLSGGKSYAMLLAFFQEAGRAFGAPPDEGEIYARMNEWAREVLRRGDEPLQVQTQFYGTRQDPGLRGAIRGIGPDNFTPGHLVAGFLQGMAEELMQYVGALPAGLRGSISAAAGSGNGIRRNPLLREMLEAELGLTLQLPPGEEEAAYGAAVYGAAAAGYYPDVRSSLSEMRKG
ncbi:sedoheptulokinase [Paenibacillus sp. XY044]|uniref:sedoheptulokinase n=1 Tax=Paenibacillus sp. XY044 TaxID=2026089 RepID=UPI000B98575F|nr:FGGY family carbohydrate kinase [Paenibacillus sp. XY044]OZB94350.1 hypothetical protein CJP46_19310 [Paenibacillus sp. XY044]